MLPSLVLFLAILFSLFSIYVMLQILIVFVVQLHKQEKLNPEEKKAMRRDWGKSTLLDFTAAFLWALFYYLTH